MRRTDWRSATFVAVSMISCVCAKAQGDGTGVVEPSGVRLSARTLGETIRLDRSSGADVTKPRYFRFATPTFVWTEGAMVNGLSLGYAGLQNPDHAYQVRFTYSNTRLSGSTPDRDQFRLDGKYRLATIGPKDDGGFYKDPLIITALLDAKRRTNISTSTRLEPAIALEKTLGFLTISANLSLATRWATGTTSSAGVFAGGVGYSLSQTTDISFDYTGRNALDEEDWSVTLSHVLSTNAQYQPVVILGVGRGRTSFASFVLRF